MAVLVDGGSSSSSSLVVVAVVAEAVVLGFDDPPSASVHFSMGTRVPDERTVLSTIAECWPSDAAVGSLANSAVGSRSVCRILKK